MKTKLTLNIDDKIVARAKKVSTRKKISLSSIVENYLEKFSNGDIDKSENKKRESITDRIRKFTRPLNLSDTELEKQKAEYLEAKYGK